jgi:DNA-binding LacI/PurR family transcriptional regulator
MARTIKEVAAVAGVSKSTVSRVLNDTPGVSPTARERVRSAIERTGYQPNRAARSLVTRATGSIGLVVSEPHARMFSDPFFASMVRGATEVVRPLGIHLVLMLAEDQRARDQLLAYLRHGHVDGVLFVSTHAADPLPRILVTERLPAVLSARPLGRLSISYVDVDSVAGAGLAVDHLVERGRRRWPRTGWCPARSRTGTSTGAAGRGRWRSCWPAGSSSTGCSWPPT